jgi:hypothetical protein
MLKSRAIACQAPTWDWFLVTQTGMVKLSGVGDCSAEFNHTR